MTVRPGAISYSRFCRRIFRRRYPNSRKPLEAAFVVQSRPRSGGEKKTMRLAETIALVGAERASAIARLDVSSTAVLSDPNGNDIPREPAANAAV